MEVKQCFEPGCMHEILYECKCTSPGTYSCKMHFGEHLMIPNKDHKFEISSVEPCKGTKEAILKALAEKSSKLNKIKGKILASFTQNFLSSQSSLEELIKDLDSSSNQLNNFFLKVMEVQKLSKSEKDPVLRLLSLQPEEAVEKFKAMIPDKSYSYENAKIFCGFSEKIENMIECFIQNKFEAHLEKKLVKIESNLEEQKSAISLANYELANVKDSISEIKNLSEKSKNELEDWKRAIELKAEKEASLLNSQITLVSQDLDSKLQKIKISILEENKAEELIINTSSPFPKNESDSIASSSSSVQAYQDCYNVYQESKSLYNTTNGQLLVFNTESGSQEVQHLQVLLDSWTCITQLPNSKLFCFGSREKPRITVMIDENYKVESLPSGAPCLSSSGIHSKNFRIQFVLFQESHSAGGAKKSKLYYIYFNDNVYCFGGADENGSSLKLSSRFDLIENKWKRIKEMPIADHSCSSLIFNGNILISGMSKIFDDIQLIQTPLMSFLKNLQKEKERFCYTQRGCF